MIQGMATQKSSAENLVMFLVPNRVLNQPDKGIATMAPAAMTSNKLPSPVLLKPKKACNSGKRAIQLAYKKPFTKKKVEMATLLLFKLLFVILTTK